MRNQKATQSRVFFCKIFAIVCVGFAMKCSCGLLLSSLSSRPAAFLHACTWILSLCELWPDSPTRSPHHRGNISVWRQTGGRHDVSVWVAAERVAARRAWTHEPRTAHCSEESGEGWGVAGERVRAAAGGLCELSVWLLIIQNGCKVETVLFLCGPYHSPRQRIWPDSVPTQRGRRRARALPRIAVHALGKTWTWPLRAQWCTAPCGSLEPEPSAQEQKKKLIFFFFFPKLLK